MDWIALLSELGHLSLSAFWLPLLVWTVAALPFYVGLGLWSRAHPLVRYHGYLALLLALPLGFILTPLAEPVAVSPIPSPGAASGAGFDSACQPGPQSGPR